MDITTAIKQIKDSAKAHFDESVEVIINLDLDIKKQGGIRALTSLPHGTGKSLRIEAVDGKNVEEFILKIESGKVKPKVDFDVLIATPDSMAKLSKIARILGPQGVMPNPKNGTVTPDLEKAKKEFSGGKIEVKTEADMPIIHSTIGKVSFDEKALLENYEALLKVVEGKTIKSIFLKSSMGKSFSILSS